MVIGQNARSIECCRREWPERTASFHRRPARRNKIANSYGYLEAGLLMKMSESKVLKRMRGKDEGIGKKRGLGKTPSEGV